MRKSNCQDYRRGHGHLPLQQRLLGGPRTFLRSDPMATLGINSLGKTKALTQKHSTLEFFKIVELVEELNKDR
jgi:hypothetical protein